MEKSFGQLLFEAEQDFYVNCLSYKFSLGEDLSSRHFKKWDTLDEFDQKKWEFLAHRIADIFIAKSLLKLEK